MQVKCSLFNIYQLCFTWLPCYGRRVKRNVVRLLNIMDITKKEILDLVSEANNIIPVELLPNLEPLDGNNKITKWYDFESKVWQIGEQIRQKINSLPKLRKDKELQEIFIGIAKNKNAKRGRQSFIMLLAYKDCSSYAEVLLSELNDPDVEGHVIYALRKMQASTFINFVLPYLNSPVKY